MPRLQSTMSVGLIKGPWSCGQVSSLSPPVFQKGTKKKCPKKLQKEKKKKKAWHGRVQRVNLYLCDLFAKCSLLLWVRDGKFGVMEGKCKNLYLLSRVKLVQGGPSGNHVLSIISAWHPHRQPLIKARLACKWKWEAEVNVRKSQVFLVFFLFCFHKWVE